MSIINRYLNFNNNLEVLDNLGIHINQSIIEYNKYYNESLSNPNIVVNYIKEKLEIYLSEKHSKIGIIGTDINYHIEHINLFTKKNLEKLLKKYKCLI